MDPRSLHVLEYDKIVQRLARLAHSQPGRERCQAIRPRSDYDQALRLQDETADALDWLMKKGALSLTGVHDIRPAVGRAQAGSACSLRELLQIAQLLQTVKQLRAQLMAKNPPQGVMGRLIQRLAEESALLRRLTLSVASEEALHDQASPELARIRKQIHQLQNKVKEQLDRIVRTQGAVLQEQLVTLRGDRYVVPVKAEHRQAIRGLVHDTSASGATLFIEPLAVVDLNNRIRESRGREQDECTRIILDLSVAVAQAAPALQTNVSLCAELDYIQARAQLALDLDGRRPELNTRGAIRLLAARHPLIPKDRVVPIQFELGQAFQTLVITGPNTGGKTVALKTCGLFVLMGLSGLQLPAQAGSQVPVLRNVLADIGDEQSIEQDLSTFSSHMKNLIRILDLAGPDTLVLTDELGSGTDPTEGAALAIALLELLREKGCLTVATTHYKELKAYALQTAGVENASCEFNAETLQPTFRLLIGLPGVSNAFAISSRLGLDQAVIDRARTLLTEEGIQFEALVRALETSRREAEAARQEAEALRRQAAEEARQVRAEKERLQTNREQLTRQIRADIEKQFAGLLEEADALQAALHQQLAQERLQERLQSTREIRSSIRSGLSRVQADVAERAAQAQGRILEAEDLVVGQLYAAPALGLTGRLLAGPDNRDHYQLQSEAMSVWVPRQALRLVADQPVRVKGRKRPAGQDLASQKRQQAVSELHLLGQTVLEATDSLDRFIDDAILADIHTIRIVHGKGTGALRQAVQEQLRRDKRVSSFRLAAYGEGDSGVTLAELH